MESHYQLFLHEDPPRIGAESASTKTEKLNDHSSAFPTFIDLTDSQNSSEDFAISTPTTLKNRSNFLKSSQLHKSKLAVPSKTQKRKRRISKNSSMKQENIKRSLNDSTYEDVSLSQLSTQTKTPFTIALQQRRNLQRRKSKVSNHDSIDLTQDVENNESKVSCNNKSNPWKHSKIVDLCDSSSSETESVVKPFITLRKSPKKLKRPFLSSTQRDDAASSKRIKHDLSAVIESPIAAKQRCIRQTHDLEPGAPDVEASCQNKISSKNNNECENGMKISDSIESNGRLQFSARDSTKYPHFQSTQISDASPQLSVPTSLETLDSEDLPTLQPRGPGFVPMTPIAHDKDDNHGHQTDTDEEEDLFSMSPFDKSSDVQFIDVMSHPNQVDSSCKSHAEKINEENVKRAAKINLDWNKSPIKISFDHNSGGQCKEEMRATSTRTNEARHGKEADFNKEDSFRLRPLEISLDESSNETVLYPNDKNPLSDEAGVEMQGLKIPEKCENIACQSVDMPTPDAGLSFSESDEDEYNFLDFASSKTVPFTGPPNVLNEQQRNSCSTDNNLVDRMDNFECSSIILHENSKSIQSSNSLSPSDVNNNRLGHGEKQSSDIEHVVADHERQQFQSSKSGSASKNPSTISDVNNNSSKAQMETISSIVDGKSNGGTPLKSKNAMTSQSATMKNPSNINSIKEGMCPDQVTDDLQGCGSDSPDKTLNNIVENPVQINSDDLSPLPKNFLLTSPVDARVVQKHPVRRKLSVTKCTRMLNFDSLQGLGNRAVNKSHVNGSKLDNEETSQSESTAPQPTESSRISTNGGAQNKNSVQQQNEQIRHDEPIADSDLINTGASWASYFTVSPTVAEGECVDPQTHSLTGTEIYESASMSLSDQNDSDGSENVDAVSNSTKGNGRLELRVRSNIQRGETIQSDKSSNESSFETLLKQSTGKQKKQGMTNIVIFTDFYRLDNMCDFCMFSVT